MFAGKWKPKEKPLRNREMNEHTIDDGDGDGDENDTIRFSVYIQ